MKHLVLYPSKGTHKKAAAIGGVNVFFGAVLLGLLPVGSAVVPVLVAAAGVLMIGTTARRYYNPKPCFEADAEGFKVLGGKKRDWSEFRGATVRHSHAAFSAAPRSVVIKTGKSILGRQVPIKYTHLSAPAAEMVRDIEAYAKHAQRKVALIEALAALPAQNNVSSTTGTTKIGPVSPEPLHVEPTRTTAATFAARLDETDGPVPSVPSLGERLFGRRKVL